MNTWLTRVFTKRWVISVLYAACDVELMHLSMQSPTPPRAQVGICTIDNSKDPPLEQIFCNSSRMTTNIIFTSYKF